MEFQHHHAVDHVGQSRDFLATVENPPTRRTCFLRPPDGEINQPKTGGQRSRLSSKLMRTGPVRFAIEPPPTLDVRLAQTFRTSLLAAEASRYCLGARSKVPQASDTDPDRGASGIFGGCRRDWFIPSAVPSVAGTVERMLPGVRANRRAPVQERAG
jgi:hypothetical protein